MTQVQLRQPDVASKARPAAAGLVWVLVALGVVLVAAIASVTLGVLTIGWDDLVAGVAGSTDTVAEAAVSKRVPRTVLALLVGAALGVSGAVLQGVTRNPLADPGILGITQGSAFFVVCGLAFFSLSSPEAYVWVAILGAAVAAFFVYAIGSMGRGGATPLRLALAGATTSAALSCLISAILLPRIDVMNLFRFWQVGGVGGGSFDRIALVLPFLLVGLVISFVGARGLNALALGDDLAAGLGERVWLTRVSAFVGAIVLCGAATSVAGPIAFVGLLVPHLSRVLVGLDHRWLLPMSALTGAALLTLADVVGRTVAKPAEVDVGIITAFVGAPVFIYLVRKMKVNSL